MRSGRRPRQVGRASESETRRTPWGGGEPPRWGPGAQVLPEGTWAFRERRLVEAAVWVRDAGSCGWARKPGLVVWLRSITRPIG